MLGQHLNSHLPRQRKNERIQTRKIKKGEKLGTGREKIRKAAAKFRPCLFTFGLNDTN